MDESIEDVLARTRRLLWWEESTRVVDTPTDAEVDFVSRLLDAHKERRERGQYDPDNVPPPYPHDGPGPTGRPNA